MAQGKEGFLLYKDLIYTVQKLTDVQRGQLMLTILEYVNDLNPIIKDPIIDIVFEPIKRQLKRDLKKYEKKKKQWSDAGKASAEARKNKRQRTLTNVNENKKRSTDLTVTVTDTVTDTVTVIHNSIQKKQNDFLEEVRTFKGEYTDEMLNAFYSYWSEPNKSKTKMRKDLEKTWDTSRRLVTWYNRSKK